jgi:hypothetical protein
MDLRCEHRLHGQLEGGCLVVQCRSALCGKREGVVVRHYFPLLMRDGQLMLAGPVRTKRYQEVPVLREEEPQHVVGHCAAVRST